jgi:large subunit ribosomal protein L23
MKFPAGRKSTLIRKPVVTEKSMKLLSSQNVATFEVDRLATKPMIKRAIQDLFNVRVKRVRTHQRPGKWVNARQGFLGHKSAAKRAFIELYPGEKISVFDQGAQV